MGLKVHKGHQGLGRCVHHGSRLREAPREMAGCASIFYPDADLVDPGPSAPAYGGLLGIPHCVRGPALTWGGAFWGDRFQLEEPSPLLAKRPAPSFVFL